ncbi:hypothetical protein QFZ91_000208 [Paraburkholderia sp. JPY419]
MRLRRFVLAVLVGAGVLIGGVVSAFAYQPLPIDDHWNEPPDRCDFFLSPGQLKNP